MKKKLFLLLLMQSIYTNAQVETFVTPNGKKVEIDTTPQWSLNGNSNNGEKSIGKTSLSELTIGTNNNPVLFLSNNKVFINTTQPLIGGGIPKVLINGSIQITDGTQGANKVLTSDANGVATWKASAVSTKIYEYSVPHPALITLPYPPGQAVQVGSNFNIPVSGTYRVYADMNIPRGYILQVGSSALNYSNSSLRFLQHTLIYLQAGPNSIRIYNDNGTDSMETGGPYWSFRIEGPVN